MARDAQETVTSCAEKALEVARLCGLAQEALADEIQQAGIEAVRVADLDRVRAWAEEAQRGHAIEVERLRIEAAREQSRVAHAVQVRTEAEAAATLTAVLDHARAETHHARVAEAVARVQAEAELVRVAAVAEARKEVQAARFRAAQLVEQARVDADRVTTALTVRIETLREAEDARIAELDRVRAQATEAQRRQALEVERMRAEAEHVRVAAVAQVRREAQAAQLQAARFVEQARAEADVAKAAITRLRAQATPALVQSKRIMAHLRDVATLNKEGGEAELHRVTGALTSEIETLRAAAEGRATELDRVRAQAAEARSEAQEARLRTGQLVDRARAEADQAKAAITRLRAQATHALVQSKRIMAQLRGAATVNQEAGEAELRRVTTVLTAQIETLRREATERNSAVPEASAAAQTNASAAVVKPSEVTWERPFASRESRRRADGVRERNLAIRVASSDAPDVDAAIAAGSGPTIGARLATVDVLAMQAWEAEVARRLEATSRVARAMDGIEVVADLRLQDLLRAQAPAPATRWRRLLGKWRRGSSSTAGSSTAPPSTARSRPGEPDRVSRLARDLGK